MELRQVLETYVSFKDLKLEALHQAGFETYIRGLSSIEAAFMTAIQALRKIIYSEARRCGVGTWLRTVLAFRKFDKLSKQVDVTGLSTDLKKHFDTLQKQAAESGPRE